MLDFLLVLTRGYWVIPFYFAFNWELTYIEEVSSSCLNILAPSLVLLLDNNKSRTYF